MTSNPSDAVVAAWARLLRAQHRTQAHVEHALKLAGRPPLVWYDALLELSRAGAAGLRPSELEREMLLPQYGLSRLLGRMEQSGLIRSGAVEDDGRGRRFAITRAGSAELKKTWPVYAKAIEEAVGARLTDREAATLGTLLAKLIGNRDR